MRLNLDDYFKESERKNKLVQSEEYLSWLDSFTEKNQCLNDENSYNDEKDNENVGCLSHLYYFVSIKAQEQNLFKSFDENDEFCEGYYLFKLKNNYYRIENFSGQGTITFLKRLENEPLIDVVLLDEEVPQDVLKDRELVQYIIINKDYIGKIDSAKFGVHIGHACTICAIEESDTEKFKRWYKKGSLQKKIILTASTSKLEELEKDFYSVRDLGFTEVENGTLLAVSLGIKSRKEAKQYIKRLQTWKD